MGQADIKVADSAGHEFLFSPEDARIFVAANVGAKLIGEKAVAGEPALTEAEKAATDAQSKTMSFGASPKAGKSAEGA